MVVTDSYSFQPAKGEIHMKFSWKQLSKRYKCPHSSESFGVAGFECHYKRCRVTFHSQRLFHSGGERHQNPSFGYEGFSEMGSLNWRAL
ncbi:hypothetical protein CEXT_708341 [Caerostris extrusa]|uniref:C2H2-type domain-containing protein n=1 Tax=Caerostris extrusa TaxID=172846 RepID=A0AAV4T0A6_CAEEX|nr:hypothetical protein CEXT_708341 [Caerostris extrusa]